MPKPDFITEEDLARWSNNIDTDLNLPRLLANDPTIREVCYAGLWLCEELEKLECPNVIIVRIQETAGRLSFGRDPWDVSISMIHAYKNDQLVFDSDSNVMTN
jgi:hypothetical protein